MRCPEYNGEMEYYDGGEPDYEGRWSCQDCAFVEYDEPEQERK